MFKRLVLSFCNIFFPPVAVMLLTGPNGDFVLNCCLFLLAVFPSHIHSFYITFTYFHRKRKVRKGIYPGKPKSLIFSDKVNNGGASRREMEILKTEMEDGKLSRRTSKRRSKRVSGFDDGHEKYYDGALSPEITRTSSRRSRRYDDVYADQDLSRRSSRRLY